MDSIDDIYNVTGTITEIQKFSVHDGPGIRTLIFFKGCPLRCAWCCNPETLQREPQQLRQPDGKIETVGKSISVEELMREIRKDIVYYRRSGGGVTISGGEVLFQPDFARAILQACKMEGLHTAIETSSFADFSAIEKILPYLDLAMCDLKHVDADKHQAMTGRPNAVILDNLRRIGLSGVQIVIRVPVVPGFNDTPAEIAMISSYAASLPGVRKLHLLPYHRLAEGKYAGLGIDYKMIGTEPLSAERMDELLIVAKKSGLNCQIDG